MLPVIALSIIVLFATVVHAATGFGGTLLVITLAAAFYPLEEIIALIIPLNILLNIYIVWRYRQHVHKRELLRSMIPVTGIGMAAGFTLYLLVDQEGLGLIFSFFIILLSLYELSVHFRITRREFSLSPFHKSLFLLGGGLLQGLFVSGGPLVVYYARKTIPEKSTFRSTLAALWIILNGTLLVLHLNKGNINSETLIFSAYLLPALIAGTVAGEKLHHTLSNSMFNLIVYLLILLGGVSLLIKTIII